LASAFGAAGIGAINVGQTYIGLFQSNTPCEETLIMSQGVHSNNCVLAGN